MTFHVLYETLIAGRGQDSVQVCKVTGQATDEMAQ